AALARVHERVRDIFRQLEADPAPVALISLHERLEDAVEGADFVIEAGPERVYVKREIFAALDALTGPDVILASNTSAIPIREIAAKTANRARVLGAHFWNPPHFVPLVEVIQSDFTDVKFVTRTMDLLARAGMSPVHVKRDIPGFIGNRLQHALKREAIALVASGVCDAQTLDRVVTEGFGSRLGVLGPLEQSDMIGLGLTLDAHRVLIADLDRTPGPHPLLEQKVAAGETGMAVGEGFRKWTEQEAAAVRKRFQDHLANEARKRRKARAEQQAALARVGAG
ncbi:MAG TPA: 3-hydroxyacyl-CoA dehydrogenase NAD-binding domain-containing protein, partial [Pseudolabrys sp.]|nr:3-hydroxyacyl-CoA dehydrogenase NAD-binding domain-containing protein [Pseudolabrys sp.]